MISFFDMPKLESPFEREEVNGEYICVPKIKDEYRWVFSKESIAVDKVDGTNISVWIRNQRPYAIMNRQQEIDIWKKGSFRYLVGIVNAIEKGYFKPTLCIDGGYFGELLGPKIQGNPYDLDDHLWVPLPYLREKYYYKFWGSFIEEEVEGKSDEEIFENVSNLFKSLWCIYKRRWGLEKKLGEVTSVNEDSKFYTSMASEGIVFYRKGYEDDYWKCCKLRRDMFLWSKEKQHGEKRSK